MTASGPQTSRSAMDGGNAGAVSTRGVLMDNMVKAAGVCNRLFVKNCNVCTVYCDKQVQYEWVQEQYRMEDTISAVRSPIDALFQKMENNQEVQMYREYLFDEESVVEEVHERQGSSIMSS